MADIKYTQEIKLMTIYIRNALCVFKKIHNFLSKHCSIVTIFVALTE